MTSADLQGILATCILLDGVTRYSRSPAFKLCRAELHILSMSLRMTSA